MLFFQGIKAVHAACQWLELGQLYIVFLEKWGTNTNGYRPLDFQEHIVNNMTYELLEQTCHLKSIPPLNSFRNDCPNVSITKFCPCKFLQCEFCLKIIFAVFA